jgi:hypothetical protein
MFTLSPAASAEEFRGDHDGGGRVFIGGGFGRGFYGPGWFWGDPWWGPGWGPWWGPTDYPRAHTGDIKIIANQKGEPIYVDGGYVGVTGKLKKFPLQPGNHTIKVCDLQGQTVYQQTIHVIAGKTIDIHAG